MFQEYVFTSNTLFKLFPVEIYRFVYLVPLERLLSPVDTKVKLYHVAVTKDHNLGA